MSEIDRLRHHAEQARWLARSITDQRAQGGLEDLANDLDRRATEIERQQAVEDKKAGELMAAAVAREGAMDEWKMIYKSAALEREAHSTHPTLEQALSAAWELHWREGEIMRIEGPHGEKMDSTTIVNHPKRPVATSTSRGGRG